MSDSRSSDNRPFDFSGLKARWAQQEADAKAAAQQILEEASAKVPSVAAEFGAAKAVIFGSPLAGRSHRKSDVDLLILGTDPAAYWDLRRRLEEVLNRPVDLYTEADDRTFVRKILARGLVIYEA